MDDELRTRLWNIVYAVVWNRYRIIAPRLPTDAYQGQIHLLQRSIWHNLLKRPLDEMKDLDPEEYISAARDIRGWYFDTAWNHAYDLIAFIPQFLDDDWASEYREAVNVVLLEESSGYRFIGISLSPISDEIEVSTLENALVSPLSSARTHIDRAVELLSDRVEPDYRNSVKESISAVESAVNEIAGEPNATLGKALNKIEGSMVLHPALKEGMSKLYGYASDRGGVRHALSKGDMEVSYSEAKYMLVICSGFVNFLAARAADAR